MLMTTVMVGFTVPRIVPQYYLHLWQTLTFGYKVLIVLHLNSNHYQHNFNTHKAAQ